MAWRLTKTELIRDECHASFVNSENLQESVIAIYVTTERKEYQDMI